MEKINKIRILAKKVQLKIKEEEEAIYVENLSKLESLLTKFQKVKLPKSIRPLVRIDTGYLTRKDLQKLSQKYPQPKIFLTKNSFSYQPAKEI